MMATTLSEEITIGAFRYVRAPRPIFFPSEEKVPEGRRHLRLRTFLWQLLEAAFADRAVAGSDQLMYWDASNPKRCLAPTSTCGSIRCGATIGRAGRRGSAAPRSSRSRS